MSEQLAPPPAVAAGVFASRLPLAVRYAELLATAGVERGLIGPRETSRLWERHLLNCAVMSSVLAPGTDLADIGSGAGLPGLVLAIADESLEITLIEPLARRVVFLEEVVAELELTNVEVVRARAEELHGKRSFSVVTSRAVAALPKLLAWSMPLVKPGGELIAMKGSSAQEEIVGAAKALKKWRGTDAHVELVGSDVVTPATTLVRVRKVS